MGQATFRRFLKEASAEYRAGLGARLARIEGAWHALAEGASADLTELQRELHSLAGSAETFGFAALGRAARAAESAVERCRTRSASPTPAQRARIGRLLDELKRAVPKG